MLRQSLVALTAVAGMLTATQAAPNQAQADSIRIVIGSPGHHHHNYPQPPVVYYPPPVVAIPVYSPPVVAVPTYRPAVVVVPAYSAPLTCSYEVLYRDCTRSPYRCYGTYHNSLRANEAAASLQAQGFQVVVERR